jgi:hypothetical protein
MNKFFENGDEGRVGLARFGEEAEDRAWAGEEDPEVSVSIVVPVTERSDSLVDLYAEHAEPLAAAGYTFEFVFVAEPWFEEEIAPLKLLSSEGEPIRVFEVAHTLGETSLLKLGVGRCRADIIVSLPAYRRVEARVIPKLVKRVERGADLAIARRWPRRDSWINRAQGHVFHWLAGGLSRTSLRDLGCGVRAMRREVLEQIPLYGDFARFLPVLALREGYRVEEFPAIQHPGDVRTRLYSPGTYVRRLIDLFGLFFLLRFTEKPLRFFGLAGSVSALGGVLVLAVLLVQRLQGQGIADRPLLLLGVLLLVLGVQAIALGLVGEIIVHLNAPDRRPYRLARERVEADDPPPAARDAPA